MQPTGPSLADAMLIPRCLKNPTGSKFDAKKAHRMVISAPEEHGLVSIMGPIGIFYANAVGAFGIVSAGKKRDRLAIAAHRWARALAGDTDSSDSVSLATRRYGREMSSPTLL